MVVSNKSFDQYCVHKKKNVKIEEKLLINGKREFLCHESQDCEKCKNYIIPYCVKILKMY
ncbi:MAG: hypothetical protein E7515_08570 [Ruminococcaceae bacterium]|nr:hypothetical protein [Oscillospiraceae bacterium]